MAELGQKTDSRGGLKGACAEQYVTFAVGSLTFGVDIGMVQEIVRYQPITEVPLSSPIVQGLINLRGHVIAAINMRELLLLPPLQDDARPTNIIVRTDEEVFSLLVDAIGDVVPADPAFFEDLPPTVRPEISAVVSGVIKQEEGLLLALNPQACLTIQGGQGK